MTSKITFGWRVPDFPEGGDNSVAFREQIFRFADVIHGHLDSFWVGDHFFPWPVEIPQNSDTIEAWSTLTYLLARYPQMRGGTIVLSQGYRPPALLAKMAANLQWMSGGRFILGIGAGWKENEYQAYGYDFPPDGVRLKQLEETVQIIRSMWRDDAPTFHGAYYHVKDAYCSPRPDPLPPILIGGAGPKRTLRIVAEYGDWCNLNNADTDFCRSRLETLREHCVAVGRNYDEIVKTYSCDSLAVGQTHDQAEQMREASFFANFAPISGNPDEVSARIQQFVDLGFTHFIFRWVDFPKIDGVELFIKEVLPRFQ